MKLRQMIEYCFKSYTGKVWADCQVDSYNAIQSSINGFIKSNMVVPEYLLNGSHNLMYSYSAV